MIGYLDWWTKLNPYGFFSCKLMLFPISEGTCMYANLNFKVVKCEDNETWDGERRGSGSLTLLLDNRLGDCLVGAATELDGESRVCKQDWSKIIG